MKEVEDLREGSSYCYTDYSSLIDSFELEIIIEEHNGGYQGDSYYLFKNPEGSLGILIFGWGSCSGCDALEACDTKEEIYSLRDELYDDIHWEPTKEQMTQYVKDKHWEGDFMWHQDEGRTFISRIKKELGL